MYIYIHIYIYICIYIYIHESLSSFLSSPSLSHQHLSPHLPLQPVSDADEGRRTLGVDRSLLNEGVEGGGMEAMEGEGAAGVQEEVPPRQPQISCIRVSEQCFWTCRTESLRISWGANRSIVNAEYELLPEKSGLTDQMVMFPTLEATQGQISSQSPTDATSGR